MNVGQLKDILKNIPDNVDVVLQDTLPDEEVKYSYYEPLEQVELWSGCKDKGVKGMGVGDFDWEYWESGDQ